MSDLDRLRTVLDMEISILETSLDAAIESFEGYTESGDRINAAQFYGVCAARREGIKALKNVKKSLSK